MSAAIVKRIFDEAMGLKFGESILIPCYTDGQRESLRVSLYRQKKILEDKGLVDFEIAVSKETTTEARFLRVTKVQKIKTMIVQKRNKPDKVMMIKEIVEDPLHSDEVSLPLQDTERLRKAMKEDGMTEEEIEEYFKED